MGSKRAVGMAFGIRALDILAKGCSASEWYVSAVYGQEILATVQSRWTLSQYLAQQWSERKQREEHHNARLVTEGVRVKHADGTSG
ncbi:hypothetical protein NMY22_g2413 [Coprinellus aureogranulatus]|nr:hypothetical protein NMY22_g2413 [Coprinellus aureogranulatus]